MSEANQEVLDSLKGRAIRDWHLGEGGMHMEMDDGRIVVFAASNNLLIIAVYAEEHAVH